ncbi:hypothetical protein LIER_23962 [Lithospermum erythrorhizon]|uniref:Uncharacterized protein n=1 Tax=Lithospermum erythrorhizon TaxID=34254 RepID=A0AAV3R0X0_LITER
MSLKSEDPGLGLKAYEVSGIVEKQSKVLYSREFLLSFSELEICKKLPSGFDPSILSEFEDAFHKVQERERAFVGSQFPGYKRSDYSSSPPTRGDSGTYSRSSFGRWDTHSSGRSDRGSDSHSDRDSDPGKHYVNPSRRPWQSSEHDGLLGSGHGYGSENSLLKNAVTDGYQINRSNGPYPRSYKAAPYSFRETKDSYNDETFGSSEGTSEDKVEEERQRRVSFELMRKEQHKVLQGKQNVGAGISEFLEDMKEEKSDLGVSNVLEESATAAIPVNDSITSSTLSQSITSRPLVPPGFANAIVEKNSGPKPSVHTRKIEKPDDTWTTSSVQSSKLGDRFLEERKPAEDLTYGRPNDLLSLIVGGDKGICQPSDEKYMGHFLSENSRKSSEFASELISGLSSKSNDISNHQCDTKTEAIPSVLTCENLEQTILSEFSVENLNLPLTGQPMHCSSVADAKSEQLRPVDNHASQHLLSLLHKDTGLDKMQLRRDMESRLNDVSPSNEWDIQVTLGETSKDGLKGGPGSSTPTLEALFGSAFMRELQSAEAPVSVQRGSVESAQTDVLEDPGLPFPLINGGGTRIVANEVGQKSATQRGYNLPLNHGQESRSESWLGISDPQDEPDSFKHLIGLRSRNSDILEVDRCQLSEEERLIASNDPLNHPNLSLRPAGPSLQGQLSLNAPINIYEKLTATRAVVEEKPSRIFPENSPFVKGPYNRIEPEIPHHNLYTQSSSHPLQNSLMTREKPYPFPLDSHPARMNPHMKFIGPESMMHRDPSANHQLPADMVRPPFPHPGPGVTGVNITSHNPISQQMQISRNHSQQQLHRFQRPVLPYPGNQPNALVPELNIMQGFPFGPRHPRNMSSSGLPIPAPNINNGSNHPEAFQRLLEMERMAKSKQIHPPPGHSQAMYNNELETGFRYK